MIQGHGALWAYDHQDEGIRVSGTTHAYIRGEAIEFHFCPVCGCIAFWRSRHRDAQGRLRVAVNLRLAEPDTVAAIPIDHFDGLEQLRGPAARRSTGRRLLVLSLFAITRGF